MPTRHTSGWKEISGTDPVELWRVTVNRKARLVKIMIYNRDTTDHYVEFGEIDPTTSPVTWVSTKLPRIPVLAGQMVVLSEEDIPSEYVVSKDTSTIRSWAAKLDAAVSANNVEVSVEVEEE